MLELRDYKTRNTLSEGILDCTGARTPECTTDQGNSVVYHRTNSPGALNVAGVLVSTILAASIACQESRRGTTLGKGCYSPNVRVDGLGATCSPLWTLPRGCGASTKGCWTFFLWKMLCAVRNYYWSERVIARNKTEEPSDEQPTDQEHRHGDRADRAHRSQLIARSIISFGCLSLVKSAFVFVLLFFRIALF